MSRNGLPGKFSAPGFERANKGSMAGHVREARRAPTGARKCRFAVRFRRHRFQKSESLPPSAMALWSKFFNPERFFFIPRLDFQKAAPGKLTCLLLSKNEDLKFRLVLNWRNPRTCRIKTTDRNNAMTSARLDSATPMRGDALLERVRGETLPFRQRNWRSIDNSGRCRSTMPILRQCREAFRHFSTEARRTRVCRAEDTVVDGDGSDRLE